MKESLQRIGGCNWPKYKILGSLPVIIGLLSPLNSSFASTDEPLKVVIKKGDSLSSIIAKELNSGDPAVWKKVAEFNNQIVGKTLEIGDIILIPSALIIPEVQLEIEEPDVPAKGTTTKKSNAELQQPPAPNPTGFNQTNLECSGQDVCWGIEHNQLPLVQATGSTPPPVSKATKQSQSKIVTTPTILETGTEQTSEQANTGEAPLSTESITKEPITQEVNNSSTEVESTNTAHTEEADQQSVSHSPEIVDTPPAASQQNTTAALSSDDVNQESDKVQTRAANQPDTRPGLFEVDEDSAVRALERSLVQLNALLLRPRRAEVTLSFDYGFDTEFQPVLVTVEDSDLSSTTQQAAQIQSQSTSYTTTFDLKFGLPYDAQIKLSLPFTSNDQSIGVNLNGNSVDSQNFSQSGSGDYSISLVKTLATEQGYRPDLLIDATFNGKSGSDEFSSGANEFTLGLTATKRQDPLVFTGGISYTSSLESDAPFIAGDVTQLSIGTLLAASPSTSLQFILTQAFISPAEIDNQPSSENNTTIASFSAGVSSVLGNDLFLNARLGIGVVERASDYRFSFSLAKQFSF